MTNTADDQSDRDQGDDQDYARRVAVGVNPNIVKIFANTNPKEFAVASNEGSKYDPKDDPDCPPCDCGYEVID